MPIAVHAALRRLSQAEFGELAYRAMGCLFEIHQDLGRLFDEQVYQRELAHRMPEARVGTPIEVTHGSFRKRYFLDVLLGPGALLELKTVEALVPRHRAQVMHYLMLTELAHAKLVNLRPESIEHEFVNCGLTRADRGAFATDTRAWNDRLPGARSFREILLELLRDWGAGLDTQLYTEALTHFLGGETRVWRPVPVRAEDHALGHQRMRLAAPGVAFVVTAFGAPEPGFERHLRRLLDHTELDAVLWADVGVKKLTLKGLEK